MTYLRDRKLCRACSRSKNNIEELEEFDDEMEWLREMDLELSNFCSCKFPGRFYQISEGETLARIVYRELDPWTRMKGLGSPSRALRLKYARIITDHPCNRHIPRGKKSKFFPDGSIGPAFLPRFSKSNPCRKAKSREKRGYARIFIPAVEHIFPGLN